MRCNQIKKNLSAYIDGELRALAGWRIKKHLAACPECRREWIKLKQIHEMSKLVLSNQPEPGFYGRLRERLARQERISMSKRDSLRRMWTALPFPCKAAIFAGVVSIIFLSLVYPRLLSTSPALSIDQFEEEYLRSRGTLSWVTESAPSFILIQEQRG